MKNIISFSLWGNDPKYTQGAIENVKIAKTLFKNWKCRFYIHIAVDPKIIIELNDLGAECIIVSDPISTGMLWRFKVLLDKDIDRAIVRDTDGRLSLRERNCITDWVRSKKEFHIIRDHRMHGTRIMGGVWGVTKEFIHRIDYKSILDNYDFDNTPDVFGYDQDFLAAKIYSLIKNSACIHDEYNLFNDEHSLKIPHVRDGDHYIGEPINI